MAAVTFSTDTDDSGAGIDGTIHNNAWKQAMATAINAAIGDWTAVSFNAANFTGNGSQTWTVASGDVLQNRYIEINGMLIWSVQLVTTTVGGTPNTNLQIAAPGGFTFSTTGNLVHAAYVSDNGTIREALVGPVSGSILSITLTSGSNWAASTNATSAWFTWIGEVS